MALYAIADLHLSFGTSKPMDVFSGWKNYTEKLKKNWQNTIKHDDAIVIAGDISWGMRLPDTLEDFKFLESLPGKKILLKGNHDYWWSTRRKIEDFFLENGLVSFSVLFNSCEATPPYAICGTRGWSYDCSEAQDQKILAREVQRLRVSIQEAKKTGLEPITFLHYPPILMNYKCQEILDVLAENRIKCCFYGHIHGRGAAGRAFQGEEHGTRFRLISADYLDFKPFFVSG